MRRLILIGVMIVTPFILISCSVSKPQLPAHKPGESFKDCSSCPEVVVLSGGHFTMGSPPSESGRADDEGPQHGVSLSSFAVGKYEVTFEEWDACLAAGGCNGYRPDDLGWGRETRPVINVTWNLAQAYVRWLSEMTGRQYRLLSEAEWEYAARSETRSTWYWGDVPDQACVYANLADRTARAKFEDKYRTISDCDDSFVFTAPVGQFTANQFGLYDMIGNVWEWVQDCWKVSYANAPTDGTALDGQTCIHRVLRGGSWDDEPFKSRTAYRFHYWSDNRNYRTGFRVAAAP